LTSILLPLTLITSPASAQGPGYDKRYCGTGKQKDYRGTISTTVGGRECQRWDTNSPHSHSRTAANYPNSDLVENYCRNPDNEPSAWCYTSDPAKRWERCDVPYCPYISDEQVRGEIYGNGTASETSADYFEVALHNETLQVIREAEVEYDQNENVPGQTPIEFDNHSDITMTGNTWTAYVLPKAVDIEEDTILEFSFTLTQEPDAGFVAVCLDEDTEEYGDNGVCFVLKSTQGWLKDYVNVPAQTSIGSTSEQRIPIGDMFTGSVNYIAFIQDSDGADRSVGQSTISGIKLSNVEDETLQISMGSHTERSVFSNSYISNNQVSVSNNGVDSQDTKDFWLHVSESGSSIQINGNQWKALPLPDGGYDITSATILEFTLQIDESVDFLAVCLDNNTDVESAEVAGKSECVWLQSSDGWSSSTRKNWKHLTTSFETGVSRRVAIPMGQYRGLGEGEVVNAKYIAFIQDIAFSSKWHQGRSAWSDFRLYEQNLDDLELSLFGVPVSIPNVQLSLEGSNGELQDSRDHILSVDGTSVTASGNNWKYFNLGQTITVTAATMLKFKFSLTEKSEYHFICLLKPGVDYVRDGRDDCFLLAGLSNDSMKQFLDVRPAQRIQDGEVFEFNINVGSYFEGEVAAIGYGLDNDLEITNERTSGQSTWSDVEIYDLPSLMIKMDGVDIAVPNKQISYKSHPEDNRPIRDWLVDIDSTGLEATVKGNAWRAFEFPQPLSIHDLGDFVVSFDFSIAEAGEIHGLCFEENLIYANVDNAASDRDSIRCVTTAYFQDLGNVPDIIPTKYQTPAGGSHRYVLNLSKIFSRLYSEEGAVVPTYESLLYVKNNKPGLGECQADCDNDGECNGDLVCFQRGTTTTYVPGCDGVASGSNDYCYDPDYYTKASFMRYIVFVSDDDRLVNGVRSNGDVTFGNIEITTSLTSCLADEDISFSLDDCTADNFLAAVQAKMEATAACANKSDPLLELFSLFDATEEMDVYSNIEKVCTGAYKLSGYDVYDEGTLGMDAATERQITAEYLDGGSVWNYANSNDDTATIERVASTVATSRLLAWPDHHALEHCDIGAAMCCSAVSRTDPVANDPNAEVCYVDIKASKRTARVRDGYSIYTQDQANDVYCEAFAWGTDGGSMQSALKGNALFQAGFANMLDGSVEQIPGAPLCGCLDRMPVVTNAKCTQVTSTDSTVNVTFDKSLGVFDSSLALGTISTSDCGDIVDHYRALEGGEDTPESLYVAGRVVGATGCTEATTSFLSSKGLEFSATGTD